MATIVDEILIRAGLDPSGLNRGVAEIARILGGINQRIRGAAGNALLAIDFPDMSVPAARAAEQVATQVRKTLDSRLQGLSTQLANNTIDPAAFDRRTGIAVARVHARIRALREELSSRGLLTPALSRSLESALPKLTASAAAAMDPRAFADAVKAMRPQMAAAFDDALVGVAREAAQQARQQIANTLRDTSRDLREVGRTMRSIGQALTVGVTLPVTALGVQSLRSAARLDQLERGLTSVVGNARVAEQQLRELDAVAELPGIGFAEAVQGATNLQLLGFSAEDTRRTLIGLGNAIALTGGGRVQLERVTTQLTQMASAARILTHDLRPIIQQAPGVGRAVAQMFGTVRAEDIEDLGLSFDTFLRLLQIGMENLPRATVGIREIFDRIRDDIFQASAAIGNAMVPLVEQLALKFQEFAKAIQAASPEVLQWGIAAGVAATTAGPLIVGLSSLVTLFGQLAAVAGVGLIPLLAGMGAVTVGLAGLVALYTKTALETAAAAKAQREYNDSIREMSAARAATELHKLRQEIRELETQIATLENRRGQAFSGQFGAGNTSFADSFRLAELRRELAKLQESAKIALETFQSGGNAPSTIEQAATEVGNLIQQLRALRVAEEDTSAVEASLRSVRDRLVRVVEAARDFSEEQRDALAVIELIDATLAARRTEDSSSDPLRDEVELLARARELHQLRAADIQRAITLEREFARMLESGNLSLQDRVRYAELLSDLPRFVQELEIVPQLAEIPQEAVITLSGVRIENLEEAAKRYQEQVKERVEREAVRANLNLDIIPTFNLTGVTEQIDAAQSTAQEATRTFADTVTAGRQVFSSLAEAAEATDVFSREILRAVRALDVFGTSFQSIGFGLNLQRVGDEAMEAAQALRAAASNAVQVEQATQQIREAGAIQLQGSFATVAGAVGLVTGAVSLLGGIADAIYQRDREREAATRAATRALERFRLTLEAFDASAPANINAALEAIGSFSRSELSRFARNDQWRLPIDLVNRVIEARLEEFGLTIAELNAIAESFNIKLFTEGGRVIVENWELLAQQLELARTAVAQFTQSFDDQRTLIEARQRITGAEITPEIRIAGEIDLLEMFAPELVRAFGLDQIDLSIPGAFENLRAILLTIFEDIRNGAEAGIITPELLDRLPEGVRTLLEVILNMADAVNEVTTPVRELADALLNVPQGFRILNVELERFNATRALTAEDLAGRVPPPPPPATPAIPQIPAGGAPPRIDPQVPGNPQIPLPPHLEPGALAQLSQDLDATVRPVLASIRDILEDMAAGVPVEIGDIREHAQELRAAIERIAETTPLQVRAAPEMETVRQAVEAMLAQVQAATATLPAVIEAPDVDALLADIQRQFDESPLNLTVNPLPGPTPTEPGAAGSAASAAGPSYVIHDNRQITVTITQREGEDGEAFFRRVERIFRELDERDALTYTGDISRVR